MKNKLIVALDVSTLAEAQKLVRQLAPVVKHFKVGSELFTAAGPAIIDFIRRRGGRVFLDLKFHDIPHTVARAVRAAARPGVFLINVHASGGAKMMREAAAALKGRKARPRLIAVTVLTSMDDRDLKEIGTRLAARAQVLRLARLAKAAGLDGVVASAREVKAIRRLGRKFLIVTPGIRPTWAVKGDQKRIATPARAVGDGADFIVVGRPITRHARPREAARRVLAEF